MLDLFPKCVGIADKIQSERWVLFTTVETSGTIHTQRNFPCHSRHCPPATFCNRHRQPRRKDDSSFRRLRPITKISHALAFMPHKKEAEHANESGKYKADGGSIRALG